MSARNRPVSPPTPKTKSTPSANSIGTVSRMAPFHSVCSQLRKSIIAGAEMSSVSTMKAWPSSGLSDVTNMWWP